MNRNWQLSLWQASFILLTLNLVNLNESHQVLAQIIPDNTLGNEKSVVMPINPQVDRIDGGAIRGTNLFHSFLEFNIEERHAAYFANPGAIQTIFSRVTGSNPSHLFGTLGVLGNANLFFINPNGIIFGSNASLDISGSFVASTAKSMIFPDGNQFNATHPNGPPMLTIKVSVPIGLQFEGDPSGTIINAGDLNTGQNLALIGGTVVSTGQLLAPTGQITVSSVSQGVETVVQLDERGGLLGEEIQPSDSTIQQTETAVLSLPEMVVNGGEEAGLRVDSQGQVKLISSDKTVETGDIVIAGSSDRVSLQGQTTKLSAGNNLLLVESLLGTTGEMTLLAKDTVWIRDSVQNPFVVAAGKNLLLQGNVGVDIFALNHPQSGLFSGGELVLRSANVIGGDAHYWSGGSFRIEQLDGSLGNLVSFSDPIIRSQGDVSFSGYIGSSLHILAGGSVKIDFVQITDSDPVNGLVETVTLSNGTTILIDGRSQPTLDIRAGVDPTVVGSTLFNPFDFFPFNPNSSNVILNPNFSVSPTSADINIGTIVFADFLDNPIAGKVLLTNQYEPNISLTGGTITVNTVSTSGGLPEGNSGSVIVDSRSHIDTGIIFSGAEQGDSGDIKLIANGDITSDLIFSDANFGNSGNIELIAQGSLTSNRLFSNASSGNSGDIRLIAKGPLMISPNSIIVSNGSVAGNINLESNGDIIIDSNSTIASNGLLGGNITLKSDGTISATNSKIGSNSLNGNSDSLELLEAGNINISTRNLSLMNGTILSTIVFSGKARAGDINIKVQESFTIDGFNQDNPTTVASILNPFNQEATGRTGDINIETGSLIVSNGGFLSSLTSGQGDGGNITIRARDEVRLEGVAKVNFNEPELTTDIAPASILSSVGLGGVGNAGDIEITARSLTLKDGGAISSSTAGQGNAGDITIDVQEDVALSGFSVGKINDVDFAFSNSITTEVVAGALIGTDVIGSGGNLNLKARSLSLSDGSLIGSSTGSQGDAGNIFLQVDDFVSLSGSSIIESSVNSGGLGKGGDIDIQTRTLNLTEGSQINSAVAREGLGLPAGRGEGGDIRINATDSVNISGVGLKPSLTYLNPFNPTEIDSKEGISSGLLASTERGATGQAGTITVNTGSFRLAESGVVEAFTSNASQAGDITVNANTFEATGGGQIIATTFSSGDGGNIILNISDSITISGSDPTFAERLAKFGADVITNQGAESGLFANTTSEATGDGGSILMTTNSLAISNGALVSASTRGQGNAGSIKIKNTNSVTLANNSTISTAIEAGAVANQPSNIEIQTRNLALTNNSQITASTSGVGDAGNITVADADSVSVDHSTISTAVNQGAIGQGGDVNLQTHSLALNNQAQVTASTAGRGNTGQINVGATEFISLTHGSQIRSAVEQGAEGNSEQITLNTPTLTLTDNAQISAATSGQGNAGSIKIKEANAVTLANNSTISTAIEAGAVANQPSNIEIQTRQLSLTNNSQINASNSGQGNAGNIAVADANSISLDNNSTISTAVNQGAVGQGGNITIQTNAIDLNNQSQIRASTAVKGDAGDISVNAKDTVSLNNNSTVASAAETGATGDGGNIEIQTQSVSLNSSSQITVSTEGQEEADAGKINIQAEQVTIKDNSQVAASTSAGEGGSITVTAKTLEATEGSQLRTTTTGRNDAGDIILNLSDSLILAGFSSGLFADTAFKSLGNGGNIFLDTQTALIREGAAIAVNSQGSGTGGNIEILTGDSTLDRGTISAQTASNTGGNITLNVDNLLTLRNGSQISTTAGTAQAGGDGGNININANFIIAVPLENSDITANAFTGKGGNIRITTQGIFGLEVRDQLTLFSDITASSELGLAGTININTAGIDPTRGLEILPEEVINFEVNQGCQARGSKETAEFYNLGRGGTPFSPDEFFSDDLIGSWTLWGNSFNANNDSNPPPEIESNPPSGHTGQETLSSIQLVLPCQKY